MSSMLRRVSSRRTLRRTPLYQKMPWARNAYRLLHHWALYLDRANDRVQRCGLVTTPSERTPPLPAKPR